MAWPPHSPDLTPLDFSVFGYLKNEVYRVILKVVQIF
jgi:hypothetical protein